MQILLPDWIVYVFFGVIAGFFIGFWRGAVFAMDKFDEKLRR